MHRQGKPETDGHRRARFDGHHCAKFNNNTVGGGVLWAFCPGASRAVAPIRVLKIIEGAWHDGTQMKDIKLIAGGPLYIMDRGFYAIDLIARWMCEKVRFIVRAKSADIVYTDIRRITPAGTRLRARVSKRGGQRTITVRHDALVLLGSEKRRGKRPLVRLLVLEVQRRGKSEDLILATSELDTPAQQILDAYGGRWQIEEFHRLIKRTIGLAHLYSFRQRGIQTLLAIATLLAALLWLEENTEHTSMKKNTGPTVPQLLLQLIKQVRFVLGVPEPVKPNTNGKNHWRHRS